MVTVRVVWGTGGGPSCSGPNLALQDDSCLNTRVWSNKEWNACGFTGETDATGSRKYHRWTELHFTNNCDDPVHVRVCTYTKDTLVSNGDDWFCGYQTNLPPGGEATIGGCRNEEPPEVHQVAAGLGDVAGEPRGEFVEVALDVQHERIAPVDDRQPLLVGRRPVEHTQHNPAVPLLAVLLVQFLLDCLEVEVDPAHTRSSPPTGKKVCLPAAIGGNGEAHRTHTVGCTD